MVNGEWKKMENGEWRIEERGQRMENEEWRMENENWKKKRGEGVDRGLDPGMPPYVIPTLKLKAIQTGTKWLQIRFGRFAAPSRARGWRNFPRKAESDVSQTSRQTMANLGLSFWPRNRPLPPD